MPIIPNYSFVFMSTYYSTNYASIICQALIVTQCIDVIVHVYSAGCHINFRRATRADLIFFQCFALAPV